MGYARMRAKFRGLYSFRTGMKRPKSLDLNENITNLVDPSKRFPI